MELYLPDYLSYLKDHKRPTEVTLATYEMALKIVGMDTVDSDKLPDLYKYLLAHLPKFGYVRVKLFLAIVSAWLKKHGLHLVKEINYYTLQDEIKKLVGSREAYADDDLDMLFAAVKSDGKIELNKAMVLMLYGGLNISSCYPLHYDKVDAVEGCDVFTFEVRRKGMKYNAIISGKAWRYLQTVRGPGQDLIVQYDSGYGTPFDKLYRDEFNRSIIKHNLFNLRENTSIFQSFRHTYSQKLLLSELNPADYTYKVLMGHIPKNTTATKFYITPDGRRIPLELVKRCAEAYNKTPLMTMEVGL